VGDGAVGLCGVIAAKRLGAEQIIILGRHPARIALATEFGATDVVSARGDEAVARVRELTGGFGAHEDVVPEALPTFFKNVTISGGPAPVRAYIEELLPDVLEGRIEPGRVFDRVGPLDEVPDGYRAMNDREAIKVMIAP
jgi:threonine dehydrogenase-like Zn-dependent dehydrogenase